MFEQNQVECQASTFQLGDTYCVQAYPMVDGPNGPEPMFIATFFKMVDGVAIGFTNDPTEWNRRLETRSQELRECILK